MKAIIFGINGQDGSFLRILLEKNNIQVIGVSRTLGGNWVVGSVADFKCVETVIKEHKPNYIFHFSATSSTRHAVLFDNYDSISLGTLNILECARLYSPLARIFLCGSAMQFKNNGLAIDEKTPFEASSPYSIARIQSVYAGRYYREKFNIKIYVGYLFNHDSELRTEQHINKKITSVAARIAFGSLEKLEIGDTEVKKEFSYARDIVDAIWLLVNQDKIFEAVIGSGITYSIKDWIEYCFGKVGLDWRKYMVHNAHFKAEYSVLKCNPALIKSLGWEPKTNFFELADKMMEQK
mgnify:CR=1 FL=1